MLSGVSAPGVLPTLEMGRLADEVSLDFLLAMHHHSTYSKHRNIKICGRNSSSVFLKAQILQRTLVCKQKLKISGQSYVVAGDKQVVGIEDKGA